MHLIWSPADPADGFFYRHILTCYTWFVNHPGNLVHAENYLILLASPPQYMWGHLQKGGFLRDEYLRSQSEVHNVWHLIRAFVICLSRASTENSFAAPYAVLAINYHHKHVKSANL